MNITFANGMRVITYFYDALSKWHDYDSNVLIKKIEGIRGDTKGIMINGMAVAGGFLFYTK